MTNPSPFHFPDFMEKDLKIGAQTIGLRKLKGNLLNLHNTEAFQKAQNEVTALGHVIKKRCNGMSIKKLAESPLLKTYALAHAILVQHSTAQKIHLPYNATKAVIDLKRRQSPIVRAFLYKTEGPSKGCYKHYKNRQYHMRKSGICPR